VEEIEEEEFEEEEGEEEEGETGETGAIGNREDLKTNKEEGFPSVNDDEAIVVVVCDVGCNKERRLVVIINVPSRNDSLGPFLKFVLTTSRMSVSQLRARLT